MKRLRFSDEQIAYALRQVDGGTAVADVCRQMGVSEATFHVSKKKYANLGSTEIRELRQLREENAKLKHLVADLSLDKHILAGIVRKKSEAGARRVDTARFRDRHLTSVSAGMDLAFSAGVSKPQAWPGGTAGAHARARPRYGYRRIHVLLRRDGWPVNMKRVRRLYRLEGLQLRHRVRRRKHASLEARLPKRSIGRSPSTTSRTRSPVDYGTEFTGRVLDNWAYQRGVLLDFIRPGKPVENTFIESFNGKLRDECLNVNQFLSLRFFQQ